MGPLMRAARVSICSSVMGLTTMSPSEGPKAKGPDEAMVVRGVAGIPSFQSHRRFYRRDGTPRKVKVNPQKKDKSHKKRNILYAYDVSNNST